MQRRPPSLAACKQPKYCVDECLAFKRHWHKQANQRLSTLRLKHSRNDITALSLPDAQQGMHLRKGGLFAPYGANCLLANWVNSPQDSCLRRC